jgi:Leucine-rich repeat (LRR) protein
MALNPRGNVARRQAEGNRPGPRAWMHVLLTSLLTVTLFALAGCDKPPTWSELVNGKKKDEAPPAVPVARQAEGPKAAPAPAPKQPEAPKKTAQEAMAQFNSTPVYRRTNEQLAELASFPEVRDQITNLDIQSSAVTDAGFAALPKFDHVEQLNISTLNYTNEALANVAKMKSVTSLWMAKGAQKDKNSDAGMGYIKQMKQLTELHLDASKLTSAGIAEIAQMTQLEKLSVNGVTGFADEHLQMLAPLVNLKYLDLTGSYVSDNGLLYLQPFTELEVLKMAKMQGVRGAGLKELMMKHKGLPHIQQLTVYDNPYLSIEAYEGISRMKTLVSLDVGAANCTNTAFLGAIPPLKNLEALSVHENDALSDPAMAALPKMKKLKGLYLQNNKYISDAAVPMFTKVKTLESLTILNTAITPTGAQKIKSKLKDCKINYNGRML